MEFNYINERTLNKILEAISGSKAINASSVDVYPFLDILTEIEIRIENYLNSLEKPSAYKVASAITF